MEQIDLSSFTPIIPIHVVPRPQLEAPFLQEAFLLPQNELGPLFYAPIAAVHDRELCSFYNTLMLSLLAPYLTPWSL